MTRRRRIPTLEDCRYESQLAGGVALYDASFLLPTHSHRVRRRDVNGIKYHFIHHSGALGRSGLAGAYGSARYMVYGRDPQFPSAGYTFWVPYDVVEDSRDNLVVFRLNEDPVRSWHTGGKANGIGVATCLQGNLNTSQMTISHEEALEALIPWSVDRYQLEMPHALSWHSDAKRAGGKPKEACPGKHAEAWLKGYVRGYRTEAA